MVKIPIMDCLSPDRLPRRGLDMCFTNDVTWGFIDEPICIRTFTIQPQEERQSIIGKMTRIRPKTRAARYLLRTRPPSSQTKGAPEACPLPGRLHVSLLVFGSRLCGFAGDAVALARVRRGKLGGVLVVAHGLADA